ncbi:FMR1 neighbor protein [Vulpes lagopus]
MWAHKRFALLLLGIWVFVLFCYYLNTGFLSFVSPSEYILWSNEDADGQSLEKISAWETLLNFFLPTTCIPKENEVLKACNEQRDYNKSECLEYKCCYSSSETSNFSCFVPLKDNKWANPLRRRVSRILKDMKKQKMKMKRDAEMSGTAEEEEGAGDDKEQETKESF